MTLRHTQSFFFFMIIILPFSGITGREIEINDKNYGPNLANIVEIYIGTPKQKLEVKLSSAFCGLFVLRKGVFLKGYELESSLTAKRQSSKVSFQSFRGEVVKDEITLSNYSAANVPIFVINYADKTFLEYDGYLGLGYKCHNLLSTNTDYSVSILNYLISDSGKKNLFYLSLYGEDKGKLFIGEYPPELKTMKKFYYKKILLLDNGANNSWSFILKSVYNSNGVFITINEPVSIGLTGSFIAVGEKFYNFVIWHFFYESGLHFNSDCFQSIREDVDEIYCNNNFSPESLGVFSFVVGKWNFKVKGKDLFYKVKRYDIEQNWFSIVHYHRSEKWYISQKLIRDSVFVYDEENKEIGVFKKK